MKLNCNLISLNWINKLNVFSLIKSISNQIKFVSIQSREIRRKLSSIPPALISISGWIAALIQSTTEMKLNAEWRNWSVIKGWSWIGAFWKQTSFKFMQFEFSLARMKTTRSANSNPALQFGLFNPRYQFKLN